MNRPLNLILSESSQFFCANRPVRFFARIIPVESSQGGTGFCAKRPVTGIYVYIIRIFEYIRISYANIRIPISAFVDIPNLNALKENFFKQEHLKFDLPLLFTNLLPGIFKVLTDKDLL